MDNVVRISVVGVGGAGGNIINHMIDEGMNKIDLIVANTDLSVLQLSKASKKIELGTNLTNGFGTSMDLEIGKNAALESYEEIKEALKGYDIVFVVAGLGGGTGSGASSIIAKAVKEIGATCIAIVIKPFNWEGKNRENNTIIGLENLRNISDSIIVASNDKLSELSKQNMDMKDTFKLIDNAIFKAISTISEVILNQNKNDISINLNEIKKIIQHGDIAFEFFE